MKLEKPYLTSFFKRHTVEGRQREALLGHLRWDAAIYDHFDRVLDQKIAVRITAVSFRHSRFFYTKNNNLYRSLGKKGCRSRWVS